MFKIPLFRKMAKIDKAGKTRKSEKKRAVKSKVCFLSNSKRIIWVKND